MPSASSNAPTATSAPYDLISLPMTLIWSDSSDLVIEPKWERQASESMALTLLLGTPTLGFLGAPGVALTVGLKRGGVLLSILVLPLTIPLLIFATAAMDAASMHLPVDGYLAILGALLAGTATLSPFATAAALRISIQ